MDIHGVQICDLCQRYITVTETQTVRFGNQDFHFACYQGQLHVLMTQQAALARQMSWRDSDRTISMSRVLGS
jgi:hypothetical protein